MTIVCHIKPYEMLQTLTDVEHMPSHANIYFYIACLPLSFIIFIYLVTSLTRLRAGVKEGAGCFHCHGADGAINDLCR